jgi:hypothetical protein
LLVQTPRCSLARSTNGYNNGQPRVYLVPTYRFHVQDTQTAEDIDVLARDPNAIEFLKPPAMATPTPGVPTPVATPSDVRVRGMQPS